MFRILLITLLIPFSMQAQSVFDFNVNTATGDQLDWSAFKGKKILIVNTASKCGFTPQYDGLQEVYDNHKDKLVIIAFPANEFGGQEPGTNAEIVDFCKKNYGVNFPIAEKTVVKGDGMAPLFEYLTTTENASFTGDIKWNFEKFLIDEKGMLIERFRSTVLPDSPKIIDLL